MRSIRARLAALLRSGARRNGAFGQQPRAHLELHALECRDVPAILTVNTSADSFQQATLSLRDAITVVNNNSTLGFAASQVNTTGAAGALGTNDTIVFDPAAFPTNATISLINTALPTITRSVNIQGLGTDRIVNANQLGSVLSINGGATVFVSDITLTGGRAATGGGILNAGNLTVDGVLILNNAATAVGGGIRNGGTLTVLNTTILGNTAANFGGGISTSGTATIANSLISGNTATNEGGGLVNSPASSLTVVNSTISGNTTMGGTGGGGISNNDGPLTVVNSTVTGNTAPAASGGGFTNAGPLNLRNSIVGMNTGGNFAGTGPAAATSFNNLIDNGGSGGLVNNVNGNKVGIANTGLSINVTGASWLDGTATITNAVPHNLRTGQLVTVSGVTPNGYNGTVVVTGIPSPTSFSYLVATNPGSYNNNGVVIPTLSNNGGPTRTIGLFPGTPGVDAGTSLTSTTAAAAAGPTVTTLLAQAMATDTILQVANSALLVPGELYLIGGEVLQVTSRNTPTSVTVLRGRAGTPAVFQFVGAGFTQASALTAPATALATTFTVSSAALLTPGGFYHVGNEIVQIVSVDNPTTVTVLRGQFGTTAAALPGATPALPGNAVLTPALTDLTVASTTFLTPGQFYRLAGEVVLVNTVNSPTSVTVVRGLLGTTPAPIFNGTAIVLAIDQRGYVRGLNDAVDIGAFELQPALALTGPTQSIVLTGTAFSQTITPTGGNGATTVTFAIVGTPPPGITVTQNGTAVTIAGTPTASGLLTVNVTATDEINNRVSTAYRVTVLDPAGVPPSSGAPSGTGGILPGPQVPSISAVFEPAGFVILTTDSFGALYRNGAKIADNSVRGASIAYGPRGEVVLVTSQTGLLIRYDSTAGPFGRFINTGGVPIQGASLSFDANGAEVMLVTTESGALYRFGPSFSILATGGVRGASLAFEPVGFGFQQKEVLLVTLTGGGAVYRSDTSPNLPPSIRLLTSGGVFAASVTFGNGTEVIDAILFSGQIAQLSTPGGFAILGRIT